MRISQVLRGQSIPLAAETLATLCQAGWRAMPPKVPAVSTVSLQKQFRFSSHTEAGQFVAKVAEIADKQNHHPDITVKYTRVVFRLRTNDADAITGRDKELALAIDNLANSFTAQN